MTQVEHSKLVQSMKLTWDERVIFRFPSTQVPFNPFARVSRYNILLAHVEMNASILSVDWCFDTNKLTMDTAALALTCVQGKFVSSWQCFDEVHSHQVISLCHVLMSLSLPLYKLNVHLLRRVIVTASVHKESRFSRHLDFKETRLLTWTHE